MSNFATTIFQNILILAFSLLKSEDSSLDYSEKSFQSADIVCIFFSF